MRKMDWIKFAGYALMMGAGLVAKTSHAQQYATGPSGSYYTQPVSTAPTNTDPEFQELKRRLEFAEQRIQQLTDETSFISRLPDAAAADHPHIHADGNPQIPSAEQRLATIEKSLSGVKDHATYPSVRLSGFFHADAGFFDQDANNRATLGDIQDGVGFRRARLQAVGSVAEFTNYSIEMDFATAGRPSFMDVWGEQTNLPFFGNVRIGHFRQPVSMDSLTPIRQLEFLERSLPFQAFDPFRRVGVMAYDKSESQLTSWAYCVYRTGGFNNAPLGDSRFATDIGDYGGFSFASRMTHLLYYDEPAEGRYLLHVGGSYNYSRITSETPNGGIYRARAIPEFFVGDPAGGGVTSAGTPFFVDTGNISANGYNLYGAQIAGQYGPAHFQAEYLATVVDQTTGSNVNYDGAYVQAGYFLTGEHRTYNRTVGVFDRVVPFSDFFALGRGSHVCGWGAWEATARWSYVNLNSPNAIVATPPGPPTTAPVPGNPGRMNDITLGVNWIWNAYTKVQFNYIHCFLDNEIRGNSECSIYCTRFEVAF
jgi:phosphate-selective porin OprO/OprP